MEQITKTGLTIGGHGGAPTVEINLFTKVPFDLLHPETGKLCTLGEFAQLRHLLQIGDTSPVPRTRFVGPYAESEPMPNEDFPGLGDLCIFSLHPKWEDHFGRWEISKYGPCILGRVLQGKITRTGMLCEIEVYSLCGNITEADGSRVLFDGKVAGELCETVHICRFASECADRRPVHHAHTFSVVQALAAFDDGLFSELLANAWFRADEVLPSAEVDQMYRARKQAFRDAEERRKADEFHQDEEIIN